jgi:hypothetical protein
MMITIHKPPVGSFIFLQCLSGTELLNLNGTPYIKSLNSQKLTGTDEHDPNIISQQVGIIFEEN